MHMCVCMCIRVFVVEQDTAHCFHKYEKVCLLSGKSLLLKMPVTHVFLRGMNFQYILLIFGSFSSEEVH